MHVEVLIAQLFDFALFHQILEAVGQLVLPTSVQAE